MTKRVITISLGGSLIFPDDINLTYLKSLKKILQKNTEKYKFVIVCGGGSLARKYIKTLEKTGSSHHLQGLIGIASTRINARFMNYFFNKDSEEGIPHKTSDIKNLLKKENIVFCGALTYKTNSTTDSQAALIAKELKTDFVNLTDVTGLYNKNPKKYKNAKLISKISYKNFDKMASEIKFSPGQHFVLDQQASKIIMKNKIKTFILGPKTAELDRMLNNKKFKGTIIFN